MGNILRSDGETVDSTFNNSHQLTNDKKFSYTYDNNGNLIKRVNLSTNEVMELSWDYENRLTQVVKRPSEGATSTGIFSYKYDAFDRRIQKNINGEITSYIYDRENILLEYDGDGNLKAKYIHNTSATDDILMMEREDSPYRNEAYPKQEFYFHKDRLGNITEVTDYAGIVVQRYVYDAFGSVTIFDKDGNQITATSPTYLENPYTFTGREYDPETGFYYYRARYYDPQTGRFISEDPIGFAGLDYNLYRYVGNNPANYRDPTGEVIQFPAAFAIGALVGGFTGFFGAVIQGETPCAALQSGLVGAIGGAGAVLGAGSVVLGIITGVATSSITAFTIFNEPQQPLNLDRSNKIIDENEDNN